MPRQEARRLCQGGAALGAGGLFGPEETLRALASAISFGPQDHPQTARLPSAPVSAEGVRGLGGRRRLPGAMSAEATSSALAPCARNAHLPRMPLRRLSQKTADLSTQMEMLRRRGDMLC